MSPRNRELGSQDTLIAAAFRSARMGLAVVTSGGRLVLVNPAMAEVAGRSEDELVRMQVHELFEGANRDIVSDRLRRTARGDHGFETRAMLLRADGQAVPVFVAVDGVPTREGSLHFAVCQVVDLSATVALEDALADAEARHVNELRRQATTDELTGLPNRTVARHRLEEALEDAAAGLGGVAVAMCDIDHFKVVNDSYGHSFGDDLLAAVGRFLAEGLAATRDENAKGPAANVGSSIISSTAEDRRSGASRRGEEIVARFGGDEFVVVMRDVDDAQVARRRLSDMVKLAGGQVQVLDRSLGVTVSGGLLHVPSGFRIAPADAVAGADAALYEAKRRGRDRVELFDVPMRAAAITEAEMAGALRGALERSAISCAYQPIVDAEGRTHHVEALARWVSNGISVPAIVFISLAERTGLISRLGDSVFARVLSDVDALRRQGRRIPVAVNVAGTQLDDGFDERLLAGLEAAGLPPDQVHLEITESSLVDLDRARRLLERLRDGGIELAIDDFGTGHSSFAYLRDLPVSTVKLDRSFIESMAEPTSRTTSVVAGMIDLVHRMGLQVVAEGVERADQFELLRSLGCDLFQGYLIARPGALADVPDRLTVPGSAEPALARP
jgi:PAS domain S-box-containing protein